MRKVKKNKHTYKRGIKRCLPIAALILIIIATVIIYNNIVNAADENWTYENSGRVALFWKKSGSFGGITQRNYIHVFAFEGDVIALGSNVYNAGYDVNGNEMTNSSHADANSVDIVLYDLENNPIAIDIRQNGKGHIKDVATEKLAKEMQSYKGNGTYVPYTYTVQETGVYTIEFRSYSGVSGVGTYDQFKSAEWTNPATANAIISAWDISVFNENDEKKTGRVYADYLALQGGKQVRENYYVLTNDNYIYRVTFKGIRPHTFNIFANNRGIIDIASGNILYKSVKDIRNDSNFTRMGVTYQYPGGKETEFSKDFLIFFEEPNKDLEGYLYKKAYMPEPATNVKFLGSSISGDSNEIIEGVGGYFSFDVKEATTATLRIEFNIAGQSYAPVEISDAVKPYSTTIFYWNGKDGKGKVIPAKNYTQSEISYKVITKAGEVHVPIQDMEEAADGISFTRISNIYNENDEQVDVTNSIYDRTRSVIYYDDTAIYYGENAASTGISENQVEIAKDKFNTSDGNGGYYFAYTNSTMTSGGKKIGENAMYNNYGKSHGLRIGDHSHTSNVINYEQSYESQKELIEYLDSTINPVGIGSSSGNTTTTDYGIANYWTFTSASPVISDSNSTINIKSSYSKNYYNLVARVFYDVDGKGTYDPQKDSDYLLPGVTIKLYKETEDTVANPEKTYVYVSDSTLVETDYFAGKTVYELIETATTPLQGAYTFLGLEYNKTEGTKYLYQVIKKEKTYKLTSGSAKPSGSEEQGQYKLYGYDKSTFGTEIQEFTVGGQGAIPNASGYVTTIDVGYYYDVMPYALKINKNWVINKENTEAKSITPIMFEISYNVDGTTGIYEMRALSKVQAEMNSYEYLETQINGRDVTDYYVSAEYYIYKDKIFKHKYSYSAATATYQSFVGQDEYFSISQYYDEKKWDKPEDGIYTIAHIPDFNEDGISNWDDLSYIPNTYLKKALPAGAKGSGNEVIALFKSVIDRNPGTGTTEITITNSAEPGTIEILKYTGDIKEEKLLSGATFRVYKGEMNLVKQIIEEYNVAQRNLNNATSSNVESLRKKFNEAAKKVDDIQIASGTTRANGRIAFSGLNPEETYTVRERFAPSGYRIVEEYYQIDGKNNNESKVKFDESNYYLLQVGNVEASGKMEIRKMIDGRAWRPEDSFTFDIAFNYNDVDKSGISVSLSDYTFFGTTSNENVEKLLQDFVKNFEASSEFTINYDTDYATLANKTKSSDTKAYTGILDSGITSNGGKEGNANLNGAKFPVAGIYTFTIRENETAHDESLAISRKIFTIALNVERKLNSNALEEEPSLTNTHLEANVSKIIEQDILEDGQYSDSVIYAGNTPTFINSYEVKDVEQKTKYVVKKSFTGRPNNEWLSTDEFTFIVDGKDDVTKEALRKNNLILNGNFENNDSGDMYASERIFKISNKNPEYKFDFTEIDFQNVHFPVEYDKNNKPTTQPIVYTITIKEDIPENANNYVYNGIKYSNYIYTLKMTLKNAVNESGETDGLIDEIIFELSNNYNDKTATCKITQSKDENNEIVKEEEHVSEADHVMLFESTYKANSVSWQPIVRKKLIGRDWVINDSFRFDIITEEKSGMILPDIKNRYIEIRPDGQSSTDEGASFVGSLKTPIKFTAPGTYNFEIKETFNNHNGITVDTTSHIIKIDIIDDNEGNLLIKYNNQETNPVMEFVNTYSESEKIKFAISKELKNRKWSNSDKFTFTITPSKTTETSINDGIIKMPDSLGQLKDGCYTVNISKEDGDTNIGAIIKNLGDIVITKGDENQQQYTFTVEEKLDNLTNIECSDNKVIVDIVAVKQFDEQNVPIGKLDVTITYSYTSYEGLTNNVSNEQKSTSIDKEKNTGNINNQEEEKIENTNKNDINESDENNIVNNQNNVQVNTNEIIEEDELSNNIEQDKETNKKLEKIIDNDIQEISESAQEESSSIIIPFINVAYAKEDFSIEKILNGRKWQTGEIFNVKVNTSSDQMDNIEFIGENGYNDIALTEKNSKQSLQFKFYGEGTYNFTVNEVIPQNKLSGLAYDESVYTVKITVVDKEDGKLTPTIDITKNSSQKITGKNVQFQNIYSTGNLVIVNTVLGTSDDMEKDFNYVIKLSDTSISGLFGDAEFVNGKATIHLKSGESANILELPSGITYTIEQTDVNQKIYTTTTKEETGTIKVGGTSTAEFENTRYLSLALTGGNSTFWTVYRIAIVVSIFLGIYLIKHKRKV